MTTNNHQLQRTTLTTSRLMDFFSEKELTTQTGHPPRDWPLVLFKELLDNALDACEESGIAPKIGVTVDKDGITVTDNGPGLPAETLHNVLDFSVRVSSREHYVSPTRGAQGNALKTVVAMPFVLDGKTGRVDISAKGIRHEIHISVDAIRQEPKIDHHQHEDQFVKKGTSIKVFWPNSTSSNSALLEGAKWRFLQMAKNYGCLNPHLSLTVDWFGELQTTTATSPQWRKWLPSDPTSPHWYSVERFDRLISAYIRDDQDKDRDRTAREFIGEFDGLKASAKQKAVLEQADLSRLSLSALRNGNGLDHAKVGALLSAMKASTRPIKPTALGIIGRDHLEGVFKAAGCEMETFQYCKKTSAKDTTPWILEIAFAVTSDGVANGDDDEPRRIITGINWSPTVAGNPFRQLRDESLDSILEDQRAGSDEPVVLLVHVTCPRPAFTDRGKSVVVIDEWMDPGTIIDAVRSVTKTWTKQRKAEERDANAAARRRDALTRSRRVTFVDAAAQVMEQAYMQASDNGQNPTTPRQMYYPARGPILEATGKDSLDGNYFSQTLLVDFMAENPELTASWDIVGDDRGHFQEPHTGNIIGLGTIRVRDYLTSASALLDDDLPSITIDTGFPTKGPRNRYQAILYIEKEGFGPLFETHQLAERYDLAIMSSKGLGTTAARTIVDRLCGEHNIPLLVLHDFDKSGFSILGTLKRSNRRYTWINEIKVIDLGVTLEDVRKYHLPSERVRYEHEPKPNLRENGATEAEIAFLCSGRDSTGYAGQRVELNAFASGNNFISWIEGKFKKHGIKKVVPDAATLEQAYRRALAIANINGALPELIAKARQEAGTVKVPGNLRRQVKKLLTANPAKPWDVVLAELAGALD